MSIMRQMSAIDILSADDLLEETSFPQVTAGVVGVKRKS
jgi:hypothetical protein